MVIKLDHELQSALEHEAERVGMSPDDLATEVLREHLVAKSALQPRDEWERSLIESAVPCHVSLTDFAVSHEGLYE